MHVDEVRELPAEAFSRGLKRVKRSPRTQACVVLGFDCEYDSQTQEIVCYQISDGTHTALREATDDLTWPELAHWVRTLLRKWGYQLTKAKNILLVSHFSTAELSHIHDFWRHSSVRRVSPQQVYNASYRVTSSQILHVVDLYHFFNAGLAKVAKTFGEKKLDFDTTNVSRKSLLDPKFREYSVHDAMLCARIFNKFRERIWSEHGVDVVRYPTPASVAMAVYRKAWLPDDLPAPDKKVRRAAWRSLWGGRAEAYRQGDWKGDFALRDVVSLYPTSTENLGPLPTAGDWTQRTSPVTWRGFCNVSFQFKEGDLAPCIPVWVNDRLIFPLRGRGWCTLMEAKAAQDLGAELTFHEVHEYTNGDDSLARFMAHWKAEKKRCKDEGDKVGETLAKLFMNALIGKLSQHKGDADIEDLKACAEAIGVPIEVVLDPGFHHPLKPVSAPRIGGNIMPEWSALILGQARASMAYLLHATTPFICSTDSLLVPKTENALIDRLAKTLNVKLTNKNENEWVDDEKTGKQKRKVCPDCSHPIPVSIVRIVRNRAYAGLCPHGKVVWSATHAIHLPKREDKAARFLLSDDTSYMKSLRLGLKTAIRSGERFFSDKPAIKMRFKRSWDQKRRLSVDGTTRPWESAFAASKAK